MAAQLPRARQPHFPVFSTSGFRGKVFGAMKHNHSITLRQIYPRLTDEELERAEANLEGYLAVMLRIAERLRSEGYDLTAPNLTSPEMNASIPDAKVENPTKEN
jgi:hypothetical protein